MGTHCHSAPIEVPQEGINGGNANEFSAVSSGPSDRGKLKVSGVGGNCVRLIESKSAPE